MRRWGRVTWDRPYQWQTSFTRIILFLSNTYNQLFLSLKLMRPSLPPPNMGPLASGWPSRPASYGSLGRTGLSGQNKTANPTQRTVSYTPRLISISNSNVLSLTLICKSYLTALHTLNFPHRLYLFLALEEGKWVLSFSFSFKTTIHIYLSISIL